MANTKSAKTKVRVIERKTAINKAVRNRYRTYVKKTEQDIDKGLKSQAQTSVKVAEAEITVSYTHLTLPTILLV